MTDASVVRVLHRTLDILEARKVAYAVMGGFAVRYWGLPRPTFDVDLAIATEGEELQALFDAFEADGFTVGPEGRTGHQDVVGELRKLTIHRFESGHVWDVDVFFASTRLVRSAFDRRVTVDLDGRRVPIVTVEDLLLFKLTANRRKDQVDVQEILLVTGPVDVRYLARTAADLGVQERLQEALRESGRAPASEG